MTKEEAKDYIREWCPYDRQEEIIKALEQEPCEDCIGREEAKQFLYERIDRLNDDELYDIFSKIIDDMYNELLPVTPQPKWIPVSERLPEEDGCYLVTTTGTNNDIIDIAYYTDDIWHKASRIIAWQPLPEPYKAEGSEKE